MSHGPARHDAGQDALTPEFDDRRLDRPGAVAIVHDYLTQRGGAERVVLAMHRAFPAARIYTSLYDPDLTYPEFKDLDVRPSALNRFGFLRRHHRLALPFLAHAFSTLELSEQVVLCSSSGWAHGVNAVGVKLVYCHCPARWLYKRDEYFRRSLDSKNDAEPRGSLFERIHISFLLRNALRGVAPALQRWDRKAAASAAGYITNSSVIFEEIDATYGIRPLVIPPPGLSSGEGPWRKPAAETGDGFFLLVSRLLPYKNVDRVLDVFANRPELRLVVVGSGPLRDVLEGAATPNVVFLGNVDDDELRWLYGHARALIAPAFEDYGLTPLEAAGLGTPTLALRRGGYLDTVVESVSGYFFEDLDRRSISVAIDELDTQPLDPAEIREHASRFSEQEFARALREQVSVHLA